MRTHLLHALSSKAFIAIYPIQSITFVRNPMLKYEIEFEFQEENMDFITIDFEIANNKMNSACSMGMAFVRENEIMDKKYYLIHPPTLEFDPEMIEVHGIKPVDVVSASNFKVIWEEIKHYFEYSTIIAHNAQFDMSVLHACLQFYSLEMPEFYYIDSIQLSKLAVNGQAGNSLKDRLSFFNIELENHHNAVADAVACAQLVLKSIETMGEKSLQSYCYAHDSLTPKKFSHLKPQTEFKIKTRRRMPKKVDISQIEATVETFNEDHILFGKNVVFTGDLHTMDRETAMQSLVDLGGVVKSGVSGKTDYVVVGQQDKTIVGVDGRSTKEKKALELIEKGKEIKIIDENEFLKLLDS